MVWSISAVDNFPEYEGESQVIHNLHWSCRGSEESNGEIYRARVYGSQNLQLSDLSDFTPYADVTESLALEWLYVASEDYRASEGTGEDLGEDWQGTIEGRVQTIIDSKITPKSESGIPWDEEE